MFFLKSEKNEKYVFSNTGSEHSPGPLSWIYGRGEMKRWEASREMKKGGGEKGGINGRGENGAGRRGNGLSLPPHIDI